MQRLILLFPILVLSALAYFACTREPVKATQPDPQIIVTPGGDTIYIVNTDTIYINNPTPHPLIFLKNMM